MSKKRKKDEQEDAGNDRKFALQVYHYRAIELRYQGKAFKEISGTIGVEYGKAIHPETMRRYFARGGLLAEEYFSYARAENDQRRQMMREELKKLVAKIPAVLDSALTLGEGERADAIALGAVKTLAELVGISSVDPLGTNNMDTYFDRLEKAPPVPGDKVQKPA